MAFTHYLRHELKWAAERVAIYMGVTAQTVWDREGKYRRMMNESEPVRTLTPQEAMEVRDLYAYGYTQREIAGMYSRSQSGIGFIVRGVSFKEVA